MLRLLQILSTLYAQRHKKRKGEKTSNISGAILNILANFIYSNRVLFLLQYYWFQINCQPFFTYSSMRNKTYPHSKSHYCNSVKCVEINWLNRTEKTRNVLPFMIYQYWLTSEQWKLMSSRKSWFQDDQRRTDWPKMDGFSGLLGFLQDVKMPTALVCFFSCDLLWSWQELSFEIDEQSAATLFCIYCIRLCHFDVMCLTLR